MTTTMATSWRRQATSAPVSSASSSVTSLYDVEPERKAFRSSVVVDCGGFTGASATFWHRTDAAFFLDACGGVSGPAGQRHSSRVASFKRTSHPAPVATVTHTEAPVATVTRTEAPPARPARRHADAGAADTELRDLQRCVQAAISTIQRHPAVEPRRSRRHSAPSQRQYARTQIAEYSRTPYTVEEIEVATLAPIGRGITDLEPPKDLLRGRRLVRTPRTLRAQRELQKQQQQQQQQQQQHPHSHRSPHMPRSRSANRAATLSLGTPGSERRFRAESPEPPPSFIARRAWDSGAAGARRRHQSSR